MDVAFIVVVEIVPTCPHTRHLRHDMVLEDILVEDKLLVL
jgi:hypothetical protein